MQIFGERYSENTSREFKYIVVGVLKKYKEHANSNT